MTTYNYPAPRAALWHRQRLLDGMARCLMKNGYEATTVSCVATEAAVSKRTFYEYFLTKQDCLIALYLRGEDECLGAMRSAAIAAPEGVDRIEAAVKGMFDHIKVNAPRSKAVLLGIMTLGDLGLQIRDEGQKKVIAILAEHAGISIDGLPPMVMEGLIGIVYELLAKALVTGTEAELPGRAAHAALLIRAGLDASLVSRKD